MIIYLTFFENKNINNLVMIISQWEKLISRKDACRFEAVGGWSHI